MRMQTNDAERARLREGKPWRLASRDDGKLITGPSGLPLAFRTRASADEYGRCLGGVNARAALDTAPAARAAAAFKP